MDTLSHSLFSEGFLSHLTFFFFTKIPLLIEWILTHILFNVICPEFMVNISNALNNTLFS